MSYLDVPRIHFAGRFFVDPSTVNNDREHYNSADTSPSPWWNKGGTHNFDFRKCAISSAIDIGGRRYISAAEDAVVGAILATPIKDSFAKMVDLDTDQQQESEIYGLTLAIDLASGASVRGAVAPPPALNGLFQNIMPTMSWPAGAGDTNFSGSFQTTVLMQADEWPSGQSRVLDQLYAACDKTPEGLVVVALKFVLDGYLMDPLHADFRTGRVVGTLGPGKTAEAVQCPAKRWLVPRALPSDAAWNFLAFNGAPFLVDAPRRVVVFDLGNSLPILDVWGSTASLGTLTAKVTGVHANKTSVLGPVDYSAYAHQLTAGIVEVPASEEALGLLDDGVVELDASDVLGPPTVFAEDVTGLAVAVDQRVFRMAIDTPGYQQMITRAWVTRYGRPAAGVQLVPALLPSIPMPDGSFALPQPQDAMAIAVKPTDANGIATITLTALKDPGQPSDRPDLLDGQVYNFGLFFQAPNPPPVLNPGPQEQMVSVHLYQAYAVKTTPTWDDIKALMAPYMKLYPFMRDMIDLTDQATFRFYGNMPPNQPLGKGVIHQLMMLPFDHPKYMPVTRDLSPNKVQTVVNYMLNVMNTQTAAAT